MLWSFFLFFSPSKDYNNLLSGLSTDGSWTLILIFGSFSTERFSSQGCFILPKNSAFAREWDVLWQQDVKLLERTPRSNPGRVNDTVRRHWCGKCSKCLADVQHSRCFWGVFFRLFLRWGTEGNMSHLTCQSQCETINHPKTKRRHTLWQLTATSSEYFPLNLIHSVARVIRNARGYTNSPRIARHVCVYPVSNAYSWLTHTRQLLHT